MTATTDLLNTLPIAGFTGADVPIIAIIAGCSVGAIAIAFGCLQSMSRKRQEEQTKREVAAYLAEGSITAEDAEKILASGPGCGCKKA